MNERWDEIESVFNKVLEADESRRSALLEKFCFRGGQTSCD